MTTSTDSTKNPILREPDTSNDMSHNPKDIVISGISGRLPKSSNIEEFKKNLFEMVDCVTENGSRWMPGLYGLPTKLGKIKDVSSFDATFFGVHAKQAEVMDPQLRMLLEITHEAIVDAGFNPVSLRGTKTGVFIGLCFSDTDDFWTQDAKLVNKYSLTGCSQAMFANRISYTFDFKGPSYIIDTGCSSSIYAMHQAVTAIRHGECDAAIVGGVSLILKLTRSLQFHSMNMLSQDNTCRTFDANADGYVRSEAAVVIFLQKSMDARRVYATVVKTKTNADGYKVEGITYPNGEMQYKLMREVYDESGINPEDISYVEAHGTGTKVGDPEEVNSIVKFFCESRKEPLLIGSVKSNMGHSEPASGLCAIAKVLIAMENGMIPPNLHYKTPNPNIPGLLDGRLKVVDKLTPLNGSLIGINNFGFGGANAHVILRSNPKRKLSPVIQSKLPKLITLSGRTTEAVNYLLDAIKEQEQDDEFIALIRNIHVDNIPGHLVRGFEILGIPDSRQLDDLSGLKRPVWFVFSGMGSQWEGMGRHLMCIDTFRRSLERCATALKPVGINLMDLILHGTNKTYQNVLNNFITIAAIQIGLVDLLTFLGIHADGFVGHSVGELGCAYADGTFTAEQMILAAYWRGKLVVDSESPPGAMAAVGLSWEEAMKYCPPGVYPACHNSVDSVTISGPIEPIHKFMKELQNDKIFAKVVNSSGYAFHSKYIASVGSKLRDVLEKIIPYPKKRSSRWISSSVPESDWGSPIAQLSSAAYHVNNLLSPVLFHEATAHIPENAIVIEIAPHCLLQPILRRSLPSTVTNIGLQKRDYKDNMNHFLNSIGKLYTAGAQPKISKLYPPVNYPVSRGTPMINSLIKWDHSIAWNVVDFSDMTRAVDSVIEVDLSGEEDAFVAGHVIDGRILYPATGYITLVWKTFAELNDMDYEKMPVVLENVWFQRATIIPNNGSVKFIVNILTGSGDFEICEGGSIVVTGNIRRNIRFGDDNYEHLDLAPLSMPKEQGLLELNMKDIYTELRLRGYEYSGVFRAIEKANNQGITGQLNWYNNWISFMDSMLHFRILGNSNRELNVITRLEYLSINPIYHMKLASRLLYNGGTFPMYDYKNINYIKSGGVEMRGLKVSLTPKRRQTQAAPKLERYTFVPYESKYVLTEETDEVNFHALNVLLQIVCENLLNLKLTIAEVVGERVPETLLTPHVLKILYGEPIIQIVDSQLIITSPENYVNYANVIDQSTIKIVIRDINKASVGENLNLILGTDILTNKSIKVLENLSTGLKIGGFVILEETGTYNKNLLEGTDLTCVAEQVNSGAVYVLLKKTEQRKEPFVIHVTEKNYSYLEIVKAALEKAKTEDREILLVSQGEELYGMIGFMNSLRLERKGVNIRYVFIQDDNAPKFSLATLFYKKQLVKQVAANVLKGGKWGCYRHLPLEQRDDAPSIQVEHACINTLVRGDLSSLRWIENSLKFYQPENNPAREKCSVYYASLNFKDVMLATGKLTLDALPSNVTSSDCVLGIEYSGRDTRGRRVMGIVEAQGLATTVLADPLFTWKVPNKWTLEEAATIPVAYATSYYALFIRGRLQQSESVLIHAGSGGVGQASIALALHTGCKVFTTVGSQEKRNFLKKKFPQLTDRNIGNSRDSSFEQLIMDETNGRGIDVILNSLSEEKLQASVRCLAVDGRFLEIGKYDLAKNSPLGMSVFLKNVSFHGILLDSLFGTNTPEKKELVELVNEGIKNGVVQPLPTTVFSEDRIEQAFRYMTTGKHIGKVLLKIRDEETQKPITQQTPKTVMAIPRTYMNPNKSYILVGGLGGFGLELANWLIGRGAKYIVLSSRHGIRTGYQSLCVRRWLESGVNVVISTADCTTLAGAEQLINDSNKMAPVGGIFNLAAVLNDGLFENLNEDNFKTAALPKIDATKNLDNVSRKHCPSLDYFVVFSSVACGRGNIGQTNYGLANSAMERIIEKRMSDGLHGLAIQWGPIGDVGLAIEMLGDNEMEIAGTVPQRMNSCLSTMDIFLQQLHPIVSSIVLAEKHIAGENLSNINLADKIANILGIKESKKIMPHNTLGDLGMDSLMGTEIKEILQRSYDIVLSPQEIRNLTFTKLLELSSRNIDIKESLASTCKNNSMETMNDVLLFQFPDSKLLPTEPFVKLETKSSKGITLFLVHAIEGVISPLKALVAELERPAWGLQCTQDTPFDNLTDTAHAYIKLLKQVQKKGPYHIAGYSFGTCIAFEMGLQLEQIGDEVVLTLIDGSPAFVALQSNSKITANDASESNVLHDFRKSLAFFVSRLKSEITFGQVYDILKAEQNEEHALNTIVKLIDNALYKAQDLKIAAMLFFKKIQAAKIYKPNEKFGGKIILIRVKSDLVTLPYDYGLSEICKQNVQIEELAGNHKSILVGDNAKKIASILKA